MSRRHAEKTDIILDKWTEGGIDTRTAAHVIYSVNVGVVFTPAIIKRAESVGGVDALHGYFYQAILQSIPVFKRCYRTEFVTYALQKMKSLIQTLETSRKRSATRENTYLERRRDEGVPEAVPDLEFLDYLIKRRERQNETIRETIRSEVVRRVLDGEGVREIGRELRIASEDVRAIIKSHLKDYRAVYG